MTRYFLNVVFHGINEAWSGGFEDEESTRKGLWHVFPSMS
jgi:hypothetical protein